MQAIAVQMNIVWEDKSANIERIRTLLDGVSLAPGGLVVLPEMAMVGFTMNLEVADEGESRTGEAFMARYARERGVYLIGGVVGRAADGRGLNQSVTFDPDGREIARYTKIHPFRYAGETDHYAPGTEVVTFKWHETIVAPTVCFDLRFPELYRKAVVHHGATVLVVIANFPAPRWMHWVTLLQARAIENQAYVIGVNRCGSDPNVPYSGRSMIVDPKGIIRADAGDGPGICQFDLDMDALKAYRERFPALEDVRDALLPPRPATS